MISTSECLVVSKCQFRFLANSNLTELQFCEFIAKFNAIF